MRLMKIMVKCILIFVIAMNCLVLSGHAQSSIVIDKADNEHYQTTSLLDKANLTQKGSIIISLEEINLKDSVEFSLLKVADVIDGKYQLVEDYQHLNVDLNTINTANDLELAALTLYEQVDNKSNQKSITNNDGQSKFYKLEVGVYLIYASNQAITPFLVSIPTWSDTEGKMMYDIEVIPKYTPIEKLPEINSAPQTGISNNVLVYAIIAYVSFFSAFLLYYGNKFIQARNKG